MAWIIPYSTLNNTAVNDVSRSDISDYSNRTFQAVGRTTAGTGSATIKIEVSNDNVNFLEAGEITLSLTTTDSSDGITTEAPWVYARMRLSAISGTGASVDFFLGYGGS